MHFFFSIDLPSFFVPSLSPRGRASFFAKEVRVFKVKVSQSARVERNDENFFQ